MLCISTSKCMPKHTFFIMSMRGSCKACSIVCTTLHPNSGQSILPKNILYSACFRKEALTHEPNHLIRWLNSWLNWMHLCVASNYLCVYLSLCLCLFTGVTRLQFIRTTERLPSLYDPLVGMMKEYVFDYLKAFFNYFQPCECMCKHVFVGQNTQQKYFGRSHLFFSNVWICQLSSALVNIIFKVILKMLLWLSSLVRMCRFLSCDQGCQTNNGKKADQRKSRVLHLALEIKKKVCLQFKQNVIN